MSMWQKIEDCLREYKVFKKKSLRIHDLVKALLGIIDGRPGMQDTWEIIDHLCRRCGGRVLKCTNTGMSPGGNPLYRCADCGSSGTHISPDVICWCGMSHRGQHQDTPYICIPFKDAENNPALMDELLRSGCDPKRGTSEVGVIPRRTI